MSPWIQGAAGRQLKYLAARLASLLAASGAVAHTAPLALAFAAASQGPPERATNDAESYSVRSVIDWSPSELIKRIPELKKLEAAKSPEEARDLLPVILEKVGANVQAFFQDFPNTTSLESIRTDRLDRNGSIEGSLDERFNYLALARPGRGRISFDEYRTDAKGALAEPGGWVVTKGFTSMSIHFHPFYRVDSLFRYLGRQGIDGSDDFVVAFAQRPGLARVTGQVTLPDRAVEVLVQGVAWIDPATYQIVRLRTDLLVPPAGSGLKRQTTEIRYQEVRFKEIPSALWLPSEVTVTFEWRDETLRNRHRYSDFRLFRVETEQKVAH